MCKVINLNITYSGPSILIILKQWNKQKNIKCIFSEPGKLWICFAVFVDKNLDKRNVKYIQFKSWTRNNLVGQHLAKISKLTKPKPRAQCAFVCFGASD